MLPNVAIPLASRDVGAVGFLARRKGAKAVRIVLTGLGKFLHRRRLADLAPKRSARGVGLSGDGLQPCAHLVKAAGPYQSLQLTTVLRQGERSQRCAGAFEPMGSRQQRRLILSRGRIPE